MKRGLSISKYKVCTHMCMYTHTPTPGPAVCSALAHQCDHRRAVCRGYKVKLCRQIRRVNLLTQYVNITKSTYQFQYITVLCVQLHLTHSSLHSSCQIVV